MGSLTLNLFGSLEIRLDGHDLHGVASNKVRAMLIYLAIESDQAHRRTVLAEMFWPDKPEGMAKRNLKQALSNLRKVLGDRESSSPYLLVDRDSIQFNTGSNHWIDVIEFTRHLSACQSHDHTRDEACRSCAARLQQTDSLFRGKFLEQFSIKDSVAFEEWVMITRESLNRHQSATLHYLAKCFAEEERYAVATEYAYRLAALEPWNEENHRQLMGYLALSGQRSAALKHYESAVATLKVELGTAPAPETNALYQQILSGEYDAHPEAPILEPEREVGQVQLTHQKTWRLDRYPRFALMAIFLVVGFFGFRMLLKSASNISTDSKPSEAAIPTDLSDSTEQAASVSLVDGGGSPSTDREILDILFAQTGGERWVESAGWLSEASVCQRFGVVCENGRVIEIDLQKNNLSGPLPPEIGQLSSLRVLLLPGNELTGSLPAELGALGQMEELDISDNQMRGSIPPGIGNLANLNVLNLSGNKLSGPLPTSLGKLNNLSYLVVNANEYLDGHLPHELGQLTRLEYLDVSSNQFSGPLPQELGNLVNLWFLSVAFTELSGPLPRTMVNLQLLDLHFSETGLCVPHDQEFQIWVAGILNVESDGLLCDNF